VRQHPFIHQAFPVAETGIVFSKAHRVRCSSHVRAGMTPQHFGSSLHHGRSLIRLTLSAVLDAPEQTRDAFPPGSGFLVNAPILPPHKNAVGRLAFVNVNAASAGVEAAGSWGSRLYLILWMA
jgi:hypothetical protein